MTDDRRELTEDERKRLAERRADRSEKMQRLVAKGIIIVPERLDEQAEEFLDEEAESDE
jgi:hypothetical protein